MKRGRRGATPKGTKRSVVKEANKIVREVDDDSTALYLLKDTIPKHDLGDISDLNKALDNFLTKGKKKRRR